jgi:hypothetical protein
LCWAQRSRLCGERHGTTAMVAHGINMP